jgi:hypothetical protein
VTLQDDLVSNQIGRNIYTKGSDAFFRSVVAGRTDRLLTPANIQKWFEQGREKCRRCEGNQKPRSGHILNDCDANITQITKRHNALSDIVRRAIEKYKIHNLKLGIEENIGCSTIIYPNEVPLLWEDPNCTHQSLHEIHELHDNLESSLEEMAGKTTA